GRATTPRRRRGPPRHIASPWTPRARRLAGDGTGAHTPWPIAADDTRGASMRLLARRVIAERAQSSGPSCWRGRLCRAMARAMIWLRRRRFSGGSEAQSCGSGTSWVLVTWVARRGTDGGGALSGVHIRHLLTDRRADVDTT